MLVVSSTNSLQKAKENQPLVLDLQVTDTAFMEQKVIMKHHFKFEQTNISQ